VEEEKENEQRTYKRPEKRKKQKKEGLKKAVCGLLRKAPGEDGRGK